MVPPIIHAEHRLARRLRNEGATSPRDARTVETRRALDGRALRRLIEAGVVRDAGGGRFYIDEAAYGELRAARRTRSLSIIGIILFIFMVLALSGALG